MNLVGAKVRSLGRVSAYLVAECLEFASSHICKVSSFRCRCGFLIEEDWNVKSLREFSAESFARVTQSSIVAPDNGTNGTTSTAAMRGCSPLWLVRSMSSIAFADAARAACLTGPGSPTKVITERL